MKSHVTKMVVMLLVGCGETAGEQPTCEEALLHAAQCANVAFEFETCDAERAEAVLSSSCEELQSGGKEDLWGTAAPRLELGPARSSERDALADVAAHVDSDPSNVAEKGEYCGLLLRTWNGRYLAIRHGANTAGLCGIGSHDYDDFLKFGERPLAQWHSHPPHHNGGPNGQGIGTAPPSGGDAISLMDIKQYFGVDHGYVVSNHDVRVIYRYGLVSVPTASVEHMHSRGVGEAIDAVGRHWYGKGHSTHSAWIAAQHEFTYPNERRSPGGTATADLGTGIQVTVSYDGGVTFR